MEKKIKVVGSLNPQKVCQDKVRVFSGGGICRAILSTDYKAQPKVVKVWRKRLKLPEE